MNPGNVDRNCRTSFDVDSSAGDSWGTMLDATAPWWEGAKRNSPVFRKYYQFALTDGWFLSGRDIYSFQLLSRE